MVVQAEEAAAPRDVEPRIRVDQQAAAHDVVVTVHVADALDQVPPAELLELLDWALLRAEQPEVALEDLRIALRERPRIRMLAARRAARQEQRAQLLVQRGAIVEPGETERDGEERQDVGHGQRTRVTAVARFATTSPYEPSEPARTVAGSPTLIGKNAPTSFCAQTWPLSNVTTSSPRGRLSMPAIFAVMRFGTLSSFASPSSRPLSQRRLQVRSPPARQRGQSTRGVVRRPARVCTQRYASTDRRRQPASVASPLPPAALRRKSNAAYS